MNLEHFTHDHELKNPEKPSLKETVNKFNPDKRIPKLQEIEKPHQDIHSPEMRLYLREVQRIGDYKIPKAHIKEIKKYLESNNVERLPLRESHEHRANFESAKGKLIDQWEADTGRKWPRYEHDVVNENGSVIRKKGDRYDAHHIIELSYGGPNESWNIMPVSREKHIEIHQNDSTKKVFS